jgi:hypothetical protein
MVAFGMAKLCGSSAGHNILIFTVSLLISYALLVIWVPTMLNVRVDGTEGLTLIVTDASSWDEVLSDARFFMMPDLHDIDFSWYPGLIDMVRQPPPAIDMFPFLAASSIPSLFRFVLSAVFVGSFLLRPLVMRPVSFIWGRIVDSDQPVFTLVFGGLGALASAVEEVAKQFGGPPPSSPGG